MKVKFEFEKPEDCCWCPCSSGDMLCQLLDHIHNTEGLYPSPKEEGGIRPDCPLVVMEP